MELAATPYAHYGLSAPWSGLVGVPAGLDDGDDDTLYHVGTGLVLDLGSNAFDSQPPTHFARARLPDLALLAAEDRTILRERKGL